MRVTGAAGARRPISSAAFAPVKPAPTMTTEKALATRGGIDPNVGAGQWRRVWCGEPADDPGDFLRCEGVLGYPRGATHFRGDAGGPASLEPTTPWPAHARRPLGHSH